MNRRDALCRLALLAGSAAASSVVRAALAGEIPHLAPAHSQLDAGQRAILERVVDLILPRTDTPGALEAGVGEFVDQVVSGWYTPVERGLFLAGLAGLDAFCREHYQRAFTACTPEQQIGALTDADLRSRDYRVGAAYSIFDAPDEHSPFFFKAKELTVLGYYTSELGATQELSYNPVPGHYEGDYDFDQLGRQWSS